MTQTAKIAATTPDEGEPEKTPQSAFTAAMEYAEQGWPVLPGSAWNGRRYQIPGTNRITDGVRPTVPRNYATTRESTITEWWGLRGPLVPTVLLRSGLAFDVLSVARPLAELVIRRTAFLNNAGPVAFRPDKGRAYFMVTPGEIPANWFGGDPGEIVLLESGSWILVPPARLSSGVNAVWLVTPELDGSNAGMERAARSRAARHRTHWTTGEKDFNTRRAAPTITHAHPLLRPMVLNLAHPRVTPESPA